MYAAWPPCFVLEVTNFFEVPARCLTEFHNKKGHVAYMMLADVPALITIEACGGFMLQFLYVIHNPFRFISAILQCN